mgnify:CR=1 FL=1
MGLVRSCRHGLNQTSLVMILIYLLLIKFTSIFSTHCINRTSPAHNPLLEFCLCFATQTREALANSRSQSHGLLCGTENSVNLIGEGFAEIDLL